MITRFKRMDFAHIDCKASILADGWEDTENITIGCFGYYLESDGHRIVVDTGILDIDTVNLTKSSKDDWKRGSNEFSMEENLQKIGVKAEEVDTAFITHSHYDHISGVCIFKNARIYMARTEYEYLVCGANPHKKYLENVIEFLKQKEQSGALILVDREFKDGTTEIKVVGGHTPGSMMIYIDELLFTGDAVFLLQAVAENRPIGFCSEPENALYAVKLCSEHKGPLLTGHDLSCGKDLEKKYV